MTFPLSLNAMPTTYLSDVVFPFAPNRRGDRPHAWDAPVDAQSTPAGLSIFSQRPDEGTESWTLGFDGLSRADAKALEDFVIARKGCKEGFWCPSFQHDFYADEHVHIGGSVFPAGDLAIREWGYATTIYPLGFPYRHIAGYRGGTLGGSWCFQDWAPNGDTITDPVTGIVLAGYGFGSGTPAGNTSVFGIKTTAGGLRLMRLLWCRFADDAITTEWAHPNHASVTLRVVPIPGETTG